MGIHRGPNTVKDGLVFGYDTGYGIADNSTATRFYPGRPTTNLYTNPDFSNGETGWTFGSWDGNISHTATTVVGRDGNVVSANKLTVNSASSYSHFHQYNGSKYTSGNTYTTSAWVKGTGTFAIKSHWGGNTNFTMTGDWQRVSMTVTATTSANGNFPYFAGEGLAVGSDFYITDTQTELKSNATPYVSGTRSSTASLIDLKRTTNIDVSNVSFDSTGQPDFDGTSDFMVLGDFDLRPGFTLEAVCFAHTSSFALWGQGPTIASRGLHIIATGGTRGFVFGMYGNDCDYRNYAPATNTWHHWVFTYDGTTFQKKFIADGVAQTPVVLTAENEWLEGESPLRLGTNYGSGTSYSKANGAIAVAKVYNRPLSATEIKQNYNAYKNRFDI